MDVDVDTILHEQREKERSVLSRVNVERAQEFTVDEGNLMLVDPRPFEHSTGKLSDTIKDLTRDNVQLVVNAVFNLPVESTEDGIFAQLPFPRALIPREKPVPKAVPKTRWEKYAELKGIKKKKRDRMVYDEYSGEWKPRYGYKKANDASSLPWLEVPGNADPYEDQFEKLAEQKKSNVSKNEQQRINNIATARLTSKNKKVNPKAIKKEIEAAMKVSRKSTASAGVFDKSLPQEPRVRLDGAKHKRLPVTVSADEEKAQALKTLKRLQRKPAKLETATGQKKTVHDDDSDDDMGGKNRKGKKGKQGKLGKGGKAAKAAKARASLAKGKKRR